MICQYSLFNRGVTWWRLWWLLWQLLLMQACASWWRCCSTRCRCLATFWCCASSFSSSLASLAYRCGRDFCDSAASCRTSTSHLIGQYMFIQSPKHRKSSEYQWFVYLYLTRPPDVISRKAFKFCSWTCFYPTTKFFRPRSGRPSNDIVY